jgi:cell division protein FtsQ
VAGWGVWLCLQWTGRLLFTENPRFAIREVEAKSDGVIPESVLREWANVRPGSNLFAVDLPLVQYRLKQQPIIRQAMVRRHLPDRISITVNERLPLARLGRTRDGQNLLVSADGTLIRKSPRSKHLPFLKGVGFNLDVGDQIGDSLAKEALAYLVVWSELSTTKRELLDIQDISVGHPDYLDWRLRNGYQLLLPREGDFEQLLQRASRLIHYNEQHNVSARELDLRPDAPLVIGARE